MAWAWQYVGWLKAWAFFVNQIYLKHEAYKVYNNYDICEIYNINEISNIFIKLKVCMIKVNKFV